MKKLTTLSPLESSQLRAYLLTFKPDEAVPLSPDSKWRDFIACGLTQSVFRKCLNTLAEGGYGRFEAGTGAVSFLLTEQGRKWLEGGGL